MESFEFNVSFAANLECVLKAFWELEDWPSVAPHVREIEMQYRDDNVQVLTMHVVTKGRHDKFKSVRVKQRNAIYYLQPAPPAILRRHNGSWQFNSSPDGTIVTSRHFVEINTEVSAAFLREAGIQAHDASTTYEQIKTLIRNNSLQTMLALKKRLEEINGGAHVSQDLDVSAAA